VETEILCLSIWLAFGRLGLVAWPEHSECFFVDDPETFKSVWGWDIPEGTSFYGGAFYNPATFPRIKSTTGWLKYLMAAPLCIKCSRLGLNHTCEAFPSGIPDEIFLGAFDHRMPYVGDNGIRFQNQDGTNGRRHHEVSRGIDTEGKMSGTDSSD